MKKLAKKVLAICLSAVMAGTMLSATAFASKAETNSNGNEISVTLSEANATVVDSDQDWEDCDISGDIYIEKGKTLTLDGTNTIDGDIYVFGTLRNTGKLTVTGSLHCLHYGKTISAGNYDYGYFFNSGTTNVYVLDVTNGYLDTEIPIVKKIENKDDEIDTLADTEADFTTCPGVAISVTITRSDSTNEDYTFTSDDGATVDYTVSKGFTTVIDGNGVHYEKTYSVTMTEIGYHVITVKGQTTGASLTFTVDVSHNIAYFEAVEPTCTEDGHEAYYQCTVCEKMFADEDGNEEISPSSVVIPAFGHDWQEPEWTWSEDYSTASISRVCNTCGTVESKDATVTSTTTATCTEPGETTYSASVTLDGEEFTDERTAETEALGHDWGDVEWTWSEDHSSATASWTCKNCGLKETLDATVTSETTDATETKDGSIVYTATVTLEDGSELATTYDEVIPATGQEDSGEAKSSDGDNDSGSSGSGSSSSGSSSSDSSDNGSSGYDSSNNGSTGNGYSSSGSSGNGSSGSGSSGSSGSSTYSPQTDDPTSFSAWWIIALGIGFCLAGCGALVLYRFRKVSVKN